MNNFLCVSSSFPSTGGLIGLMVWVAIACVVIWAIVALIRWSKIKPPQPVIIIFWAFVSIALIVLIARFFGYLTS